MAETSNRPPPPREPKSLLLPIAAVVVGGFLAFAIPTFGQAPHEEEEPETEAAPEDVEVMVTVRSEPNTAFVRVDGVLKGETPCDLELEASREVEIKVEKPGYREVVQSITPEVGMEPLDVVLRAAQFAMAVEVDEEGATILLNGEEVEDPANIDLGEELPEELKIEVTKRGFASFETTLAASDFAPAEGKMFKRLSVTLERAVRRRSGGGGSRMAPMGPVPSNPFG
ncbi:MAG: PEGA domain-containing protein [Myxococcota bacterium]